MLSIEDKMAEEAAELDGYFSDAPLEPTPSYPPFRDSLNTGVVMANLPKVPRSKLEKLTKVLVKLVSRIGILASDEESGYSGVYMPYDEATGATLGFCFVEYATPAEAKKAVEVLQDYAFDKNHALAVTLYEQAKALADVDSEFTEPEPAPFVERANTMTWLEDPSQRDAFFIRHAKETVVYWSDGRHDPVVDYDGSREKDAGVPWCDFYAQWSPHGGFLATMVPSKGVILWGGDNYEKIGRFPAPGVSFVLFSPQETYMLTSNNNRNDPAAIKIFNVQTGKLMRAFSLFPSNFLPENLSPAELETIPPPAFQWSHDDKFIARMGKDLISVFETPSMKLLDRRSISTNGIHEFQWSPKANVLSYWVRR
jgi:translation initiation factor 3 subunit B